MTSFTLSSKFIKSGLLLPVIAASSLFLGSAVAQVQKAVEKPLVVLLTPPQNSAAYAYTKPIRDGILTAFEEDKDRFLVKELPTDSQNVINALNSAADQGAMLVIGPVLKNEVKAVSEIPYLPLPVLAINQITSSTPPKLLMNVDITSEGELDPLIREAVTMTNDTPNAANPFLIIGTGNAYDQHLMEVAKAIFAKLHIPVMSQTISPVTAATTAMEAAKAHYRGVLFVCNSAYASLVRPYLGDTPIFATNYTNPFNNADQMTAQTQANDLRGMVALEVPAITQLDSSTFDKYRKQLMMLSGEKRQMFAIGVDIWKAGKEWLEWKQQFDHIDGLSGNLHFDRMKSPTIERRVQAKALTNMVQLNEQEEPDFIIEEGKKE